MSLGNHGFSETGIWQLVESEGYRVDLDIWAGLAAEAGGPVLDLGCGIGRVSHHLNRLGHPTTGVDSDPELVQDFNRSSPGNSPAGIELDATCLAEPGSPLLGRTFELVIAPQQLLQILGGPEARAKLLGSLSGLTAPGGRVAFAICEELPLAPVDYPAVPPDIREIAGWVHSSQPVAIETTPDAVTAIRNRRSLSPDGVILGSRNTVTLDRLDRHRLQAELLETDLVPLSISPIPATDRHMASTLIVARPSTS